MASLNQLHPQLIPWAKWLLEVGRYYDSRLVVTSGFRSMSNQQRLYDKWLSGESQIPAAPPGKSLHQYGLAFDLARLGIDPFQDDLLQWLGEVWVAIGGSYGGAGTGADPVHFQVKI